MSEDESFRPWFTPRRIIALAVGVALLAGAGVGAKPGYRLVKKWRAQRFAAEGEQLLADKKPEAALRKAQQALQLSFNDDRSLRLMARVLTIFGHEQALPHWLELLKTGKFTAADRSELIGAALRRREWETARSQLLIALKENPAPETLRLTSEYYAAQGDLAQGIHFARQALKAAPGDTTNALLLAHRLIAAQGDGDLREATGLLKQVAASKDATALEAIAVLAARFPPAPAELDDYVRILNTHESRTLVHEFFGLDLSLKFKPGERKEIIDKACAKYTALGGNALVELGRWLNRIQEHALALQHVSASAALTSRDLYLVRMDALAALNRWADIDQALQEPRLPLDPFHVSLFQVRTALELGRTQEVEINWSIAQRRAADNPQHLLYLAQYAEKLAVQKESAGAREPAAAARAEGLKAATQLATLGGGKNAQYILQLAQSAESAGATQDAIRAYQRLIEIAPGNRGAYVALMRLLQQTAHTRDLRDLLRVMVERFPDEAAVRNDFAYINLLLNENVEASAQSAVQLAQSSPNMLAHRVTLALAFLRLKRHQEAPPLFTNLQGKWSDAPPGWQAVYAATLAANGDTNAARQIAAGIPRAGLKPEERFLIQNLF